MNLNIKAISALNPVKRLLMYLIALSMLSQRRPNFDFLSTFRTILRCLEDYIWAMLVGYSWTVHWKKWFERNSRGIFISNNRSKHCGWRQSNQTSSLLCTTLFNCVQLCTLCSLYQKLEDGVKADSSTLDPWRWLEEKSLSSSMAHYWSLVINLQIEILVFVRSVREGNFFTYIKESFKVVFCVRSY